MTISLLIVADINVSSRPDRLIQRGNTPSILRVGFSFTGTKSEISPTATSEAGFNPVAEPRVPISQPLLEDKS